MIILDTNVLSELMRPQPSPLVRDWIGQQVPDELCTTAVTVAEIRYGLERLPDGRRKASLVAAATEVFTALGEYIYPFDTNAAIAYAQIVARRDSLDCRSRVSTRRSPLSAKPAAQHWRRATVRTSRKPG